MNPNDKTLDLRELHCPDTLKLFKQALAQLTPGASVKVIATPATIKDFFTYSKMKNFQAEIHDQNTLVVGRSDV